MTALANRLRELRAQRGYSQETLACRAGLSRQGIQKLENGSLNVKLSTLQQLALALDVTVDDLAPGAERPSEPPPPPVQAAPVPPARPALLALAAAIRAYDPLAEVTIDDDGPAVACWLSSGELCYFRNRQGWAHYLRLHGIEPIDDLPDVINVYRREQTTATKRALSHFVWG